MRACKSLYSIYKGINEAVEKTNAKKTGYNYICEDTPKNREILNSYNFPKYANKNANILIF